MLIGGFVGYLQSRLEQTACRTEVSCIEGVLTLKVDSLT